MMDAIAAHGFDPRFTPVDTLMGGPASMHLAVAEEMEGWGGDITGEVPEGWQNHQRPYTGAEDELEYEGTPLEGFQEANLFQEKWESLTLGPRLF